MGGNTTNLLIDCASALTNINHATGGLTAALEHVSSVAKRIEQRYRELDEKQEQLNKKEGEIEHIKQGLVVMENVLNERQNGLETRERDVEEKERAWLDAQQKMASNAAKWESKIQINVGGQEFATSKVTLLEFKGSFFEALLSSDAEPAPDAKIFIDRDPKYFPAVLNFMREGKFRNSDIKSADIEELVDEFSFYGIPFPAHVIKIAPPVPPQNVIPPQQFISPSQFTSTQTTQTSTLPSFPAPFSEPVSVPVVDHKPIGKFEGGNLLAPALRDQIKSWLPNNKFSLLYKATKDGFASKDFHKACDNKGPTLTIVHSKDGFIFGGYASVAWDSTGNYQQSTNAFIFTLTNPHSIPPTRYFLKRGNTQAIRCLLHAGPVFGDGDIRIETNSNVNSSFSYFPASYYDTTDKRRLTFNGSQSFLTKDVEVYSVIPMEGHKMKEM